MPSKPFLFLMPAIGSLMLTAACGNATRLPPMPPPVTEGPAVTKIAPSDFSDTPIRKRAVAEIEKDFGMAAGTLSAAQKGTVLIPGDELDIVVNRYPEFSGKTPVLPDGSVLIQEKREGPVQFRKALVATGKTPEQLEKELAGILTAAGVRHQGVQVILSTRAPRTVTVVSTTPPNGTVPVAASGTLLETLATNGWNLRTSRAKQVAVVRGGRSTVIDLRQIIDLGDFSVNLALQHNDVVILLESEPISIQGSVRAPGSYPLPLPGRIDIRHALVLAGGIKEDADLTGARLARANGELLQVDLNRLLFGDAQEILFVHPGDTLLIPPASEIPVYVFGMVEGPGLKKLRTGGTLSQALAISQPRQFGARLSRTVVVRHYFAPGGQPEVYHIDAEKLALEPDPRQDIVLQAGDVVYVPETFASDVLDSLTRLLAPLSTGANTLTNTYLQTLTIQQLKQSLKGTGN